MSNKLYTEEEIRRFFNEIYFLPEAVEENMDLLTPIKLPSDEEIEQEIPLTFGTVEYVNNLRKGAKWMRDNIQGGNK